MAKRIASSGANSNWGFAPLLVGLAFAALVPQAGADTLAWYHFEEKEVGEQATCAANAIADSSERAKHGTVVSLNHTTEGTDATLAPTYRDPRGARSVVDLSSGETRPNPAALEFAAIGTKASQTGAVVKVAGFLPSGTAFGSITVEAIVCTGGGNYDTFAPIVGLWSSADNCLSEYWSLMMNVNGKISTRFNGNISGSSPYSNGKHVINDGQWHHVALVHDGTADYKDGKITVHVYVDGEPDADYSWTATKSAAYNSTPLYIGGYTKRTGRIFNGMIDEVRISDAALSTNQFLSVQKRGFYPIDEDTFAYVPFENAASTCSEDVNLNLVTDGPKFVLKRSGKGTDAADVPLPLFEADSPSLRMSDGLFSTNVWTDESCCHFLTTPKTNGSGLYGESKPYIVDSSFTAEIFFKSAPSTLGTDNSPALFRMGQGSYPCFRVSLGKYMYFAYNNWDEASQKYVKVGYFTIGQASQFCDNRWHHVAVVYDRPAQRMRLYVDYRLYHVGEDINLESKNYFCFVNANPTGDDSGYFEGWMDEFRFTKRALDVDELLHPLNPRDEDRDTLVRASFENDWSVTSGMGKLASIETKEDESKGETVRFYDEEHDARLVGDYIWETNETDGAVCRTNRFAAKLDRGYLAFPELPYYEGKDVTAETFVRIESVDAQSCIFRYLYGDDPAYTGTPIFALYTSSAANGKSLACRIGLTDQEFAPKTLGSDNGTQWVTLTSTRAFTTDAGIMSPSLRRPKRSSRRRRTGTRPNRPRSGSMSIIGWQNTMARTATSRWVTISRSSRCTRRVRGSPSARVRPTRSAGRVRSTRCASRGGRSNRLRSCARRRSRAVRW